MVHSFRRHRLRGPQHNTTHPCCMGPRTTCATAGRNARLPERTMTTAARAAPAPASPPLAPPPAPPPAGAAAAAAAAAAAVRAACAESLRDCLQMTHMQPGRWT